jgi:hypothetical protein
MIYYCNLCATEIQSHLLTDRAVSVQTVEQGPFTPVQTTPQQKLDHSPADGITHHHRRHHHYHHSPS